MDHIVQLAATGELAETINRIDALRRWQHRQPLHGAENRSWHDAELLWLRGVLLERAGQHAGATGTWQQLAKLLHKERDRLWSWLPDCPRCAERDFGFAMNWFHSSSQLLRTLRLDPDQTVAQLVELAALPANAADNSSDNRLTISRERSRHR